jgi:hypothetical protein
VLDVHVGAPAGYRAFCLLRHIDNRRVAGADGKLFLQACRRGVRDGLLQPPRHGNSVWMVNPDPCCVSPKFVWKQPRRPVHLGIEWRPDHRVRYEQDPVSWSFGNRRPFVDSFALAHCDAPGAA